MDALDAIEALDDGAYAHFDSIAAAGQPAAVALLEPAYYMSGMAGVLILLTVALLIFLVRKNGRGAIAALVGFALAFTLIEALHRAIPRHPPNAERWLGTAPSGGSYPSESVFLFTLCLVFLALAIWDWLKNWQRILFIVVAAALIGWVCMCGFYLELHYVTDVIGGLAGAALIGWSAGRWLRSSSPRMGAASAGA